MILRRLFEQLKQEGVGCVFNIDGNDKGDHYELIDAALEAWGADDERDWLITTNTHGTRHVVLCASDGEPFVYVWGVCDPLTSWQRIDIACCFDEWP